MTRLFSAIALALATAAGPVVAADGKPAPFTIKGGTPIDCNNSPFGRFLPVGIDQEVLVTRVSAGAPSIYQLSGGPLATERQILGGSGTLSGAVRTATTTGDLDGDGDEEHVVVVATPTEIRIATYVRSPGDGAALQRAGVYTTGTFDRTITDLQVTTADVLGRRDGSRQIIAGALDSAGDLRLFTLVAQAGGAPQMAIFTNYSTGPFGGNYTGVDSFRLAGGNPLLETAEQVMMVTRKQTGGGARLGYTVLRRAFDTENGDFNYVPFPGSYVEEDAPGGTLARFTVHVADLGNTVGHEVLVGIQTSENGNLTTPQLRVRNYSVQRAADGGFLGATMVGGTANYTVPGTGSGSFAVATGQVDRRPGDDIVVAYKEGSDLRTTMLRPVFNAGGLLIGIAPPAQAITATAPAADMQANRVEVAIGDANSDATGDVYVAYTGLTGNTEVTKLRRFALAAPVSDSDFPPANSFSLRASFDFPSNLPPTSIFDVKVADIDQDSVVARIGAQCRRVSEPLVRTVVKIPPYWTRLQQSAPEAAAAVGRTTTTGGTASQRFSTFTSHDVSGYFGAQFGSETLGFKVVAKATAGGNWQTTRGVETAFEQSTEYSEARSQSQGEGLIVVETNLFDCYSYNVERGGQQVPSSTVRACEIRRVGDDGRSTRDVTGTDLVTWDTSTAAGPIAGSQPAQWKPLHPDWANIALFRPVTSSLAPRTGSYAHVTDGRFDTTVSTSVIGNNINIDLGSVQDITNIRVWHAQSISRLSRATLRASVNPIGESPMPGERQFDADPGTDNGVDRWNIWTRDPVTRAPLRARYLRLSSITSMALSEVQVFGDVHREPIDYPDAVCDPVAGDGTFLAVVADKVSVPNQWRAIQVRGDLLWSGVPGQTEARCGSPAFYPGFRSAAIWDDVSFAGSAVSSWALTDASVNLIGTNTSLEHSARFGAEIEAELGLVVGAVAGIAYEFATGATQESGTTMYWGQSLQYAGAMRGFTDPGAGLCDYRPQPYSYAVTDRSNSGYTHRYTVVDYIVRGIGWSRIGGNPPPANCFPERPDSLFGNGFEPSMP